jgi:3-methyladenine DNA glycosylase AlkD
METKEEERTGRKSVTAEEMERTLLAAGDTERAEGMKRFFKTGKGEYGEGDRFLGLPNPAVRGFVRRFAAAGADIAAAEALLGSPWHEVRLLGGLLLVERYRRGDGAEKGRSVEVYLRNAERFNNWDLVDLTAPYLLGEHLRKHGGRGVLRRLAGSTVLWKQRIAMVSTWMLIRHGEYGEALELAERFVSHPHDLMHKAAGWMLREVGKRDREALHGFLEVHAAEMPRTMLRYAIEREPEAERRRWMARGKAGPARGPA